MADTLFTNVRILDGTGANPYSGSVLVQGKRIRQVGRSAGAISSISAQVIDGAGATLMPGMCEAHTHFSWNNSARWLAFKRCRLRSMCCGAPKWPSNICRLDSRPAWVRHARNLGWMW